MVRHISWRMNERYSSKDDVHMRRREPPQGYLGFYWDTVKPALCTSWGQNHQYQTSGQRVPCLYVSGKPLFTANHHWLCLEWAQKVADSDSVPRASCHLWEWDYTPVLLCRCTIKCLSIAWRELLVSLPSLSRLVDSSTSGSIFQWRKIVANAIRRTHECCMVQGYSSGYTISIGQAAFAFRYQDDTTTPQWARIVTAFLQQAIITKMGHLTTSPNCNNIGLLWHGLGHAFNRIDKLCAI